MSVCDAPRMTRQRAPSHTSHLFQATKNAFSRSAILGPINKERRGILNNISLINYNSIPLSLIQNSINHVKTQQFTRYLIVYDFSCALYYNIPLLHKLEQEQFSRILSEKNYKPTFLFTKVSKGKKRNQKEMHIFETRDLWRKYAKKIE